MISIFEKCFVRNSSSPDSVLNSQPKCESESVDYLGKEPVIRYLNRLTPANLAALERKFPPPVVTSATSAMEAAASLAYQRVFKELRDGFVTE